MFAFGRLPEGCEEFHAVQFLTDQEAETNEITCTVTDHTGKVIARFNRFVLVGQNGDENVSISVTDPLRALEALEQVFEGTREIIKNADPEILEECTEKLEIMLALLGLDEEDEE